MRRRLLIALLIVAWPLAAAAQNPTRPRIEIGGQFGALVLLAGNDGGFVLGAGPRLSVAASPLWRVELATDALGPTDSSRLFGLYQIQIGYVAHDGGSTRTTLLLNAGAAGFFEYDRHPERRDQRPDGSVVVYHAHSSGALSAPRGAVIGIALQRPFASRAAIRWDVQGIVLREGVVLRTTVGVSIPLGGRYVR